jgi:hypothetical protein
MMSKNRIVLILLILLLLKAFLYIIYLLTVKSSRASKGKGESSCQYLAKNSEDTDDSCASYARPARHPLPPRPRHSVAVRLGLA